MMGTTQKITGLKPEIFIYLRQKFSYKKTTVLHKEEQTNKQTNSMSFVTYVMTAQY